MKIKTSEATPRQLNWLVAKIVGPQFICEDEPYSPTTDWAQGGPLIERNGIALRRNSKCLWYATEYLSDRANAHWEKDKCSTGPTPLVAAMRCYVASKLGYEVEIPGELT